MPIILKARNIVRAGSNLGQHPLAKSVIIWCLYHSVLFPSHHSQGLTAGESTVQCGLESGFPCGVAWAQQGMHL